MKRRQQKMRARGVQRSESSSGAGHAWRLQISAGVGPAEVQRFVAMLLVWMERRCAELGLSVELVESVESVASTEAASLGRGWGQGGQGGQGRQPDVGVRSATLLLRGDVEEALAGEVGTHELVALSSARGRRGRKRWYAGISLTPADGRAGARATASAVETAGRLEALAAQVDVETFRSSGPGGQNVHRRETGVRVRHRETGIAVRATQERSQKMNLRLALKVLDETLERRRGERRANDTAARRMEHYRVERGNPVRSYVLDHEGALRPKMVRQKERTYVHDQRKALGI